MIANATTSSEGVKVEHDIEFGRAGDYSLKLDLYRPPASFRPPYPAVIWIHGGGWQNGDKRSEWVVESAKIFAEAGLLTVSINYRLSHEAKFPSPIQDCKCAVRWLRAHATKYQINPLHIGAGGRSAGGHLAMMLGTTAQKEFDGDGGYLNQSSTVQAVCSWAGPANLTLPPHKPDGPRALLVGSTFEQNPKAFELASPAFHASNKSAPTLLIHSEQDQTVLINQSESMLEAMKAKGAECSLIRVSNAKHVFGNIPDLEMKPSLVEIHDATIQFFKMHLK